MFIVQLIRLKNGLNNIFPHNYYIWEISDDGYNLYSINDNPDLISDGRMIPANARYKKVYIVTDVDFSYTDNMTFDIVNLDTSPTIHRTTITVTVETGLPNAFQIIGREDKRTFTRKQHTALGNTRVVTKNLPIKNLIFHIDKNHQQEKQMITVFDMTTAASPSFATNINVKNNKLMVYHGSYENTPTHLKKIVYNFPSKSMYFVMNNNNNEDGKRRSFQIEPSDIISYKDGNGTLMWHLAPPGTKKCHVSSLAEHNEYSMVSENCQELVGKFAGPIEDGDISAISSGCVRLRHYPCRGLVPAFALFVLRPFLCFLLLLIRMLS